MELKTVKLKSDIFSALQKIKVQNNFKSISDAATYLHNLAGDAEESQISSETIKELERQFGIHISDMDAFLRSVLIAKSSERYEELKLGGAQQAYDSAIKAGLPQEQAFKIAEAIDAPFRKYLDKGNTAAETVKQFEILVKHAGMLGQLITDVEVLKVKIQGEKDG